MLKCNMVEVMVSITMNVSYIPPPRLRRIRVGRLASQLCKKLKIFSCDLSKGWNWPQFVTTRGHADLVL